MITIVDYGAGNIKSIRNMLKKIGVTSTISSEKAAIAAAEKLIIPGVGHFDYGMNQLKESGLIEILNQRALEDKVPVLGICLGAQLLGKRSEEARAEGLGWIDMEVKKFNQDILPENYKVPHMGWNEVEVQKKSLILEATEELERFYFVHTYHMVATNAEDILAKASYGYAFDAAVEKENIYGVQFHPEKSHKYGMKLLSNFSKI